MQAEPTPSRTKSALGSLTFWNTLLRSVMVAGYDRRAMTVRSSPGVCGVLLSGGSRHNMALRLPYAVAPGLANPAGCPAAWPPVVG